MKQTLTILGLVGLAATSLMAADIQTRLLAEPTTADGGTASGLPTGQPLTLAEAEVAAIRAALQAAKGVRTEAARLLAIDYQRLKRKLTKYGLAP